MSACSVCPFSNLSYARKLPPRVTAIFLLFLMFDLFFFYYLLWVPVIQNQFRIVLTRQSLGIFCSAELSWCLCCLSKNRGEETLMNFSASLQSVFITEQQKIISPCRFLLLFHLRKFEMQLAYRWVAEIEILFKR